MFVAFLHLASSALLHAAAQQPRQEIQAGSSPSGSSGDSEARVDQGTEEEEGGAYLELRVDTRGRMRIRFNSERVRPENPDLLPRLNATLGCQLQREEDGRQAGNHLSARCDGALHRLGFERKGQINVMLLAGLLRQEHEEELLISIEQTEGVPLHCEPAPLGTQNQRSKQVCWYQVHLTTPATPAVRFSYGYASSQVVGLFAVLLTVLLAPVLLTLWMRRVSLRAPSANRAGIWFGYNRFLT